MAKKFSDAFRKNMAPSFQLGFSNEYKYSVPALESVYRRGNKSDWKEIRAEYSRMRDAAQKRLQRLDKSEFSESKAALMHPFGFPKLKEIDDRDLPKAMNDLYRFMRAKSGTVYGQREIMENTIERFENKHGFKKEGFDLKDPKNYKAFIDVMEKVRKLKITYGSDYAREFAELIRKNPGKKRSFLANSRMRKLMQIAHDAEMKKKFESMAANKGANLKAEDMDTFIKNMGY